MKFVFAILSLLLMYIPCRAQELFPMQEAASTLPKGSWSFRLSNDFFKDRGNRSKYQNHFRVMYGLTPHLSLYATASLSNHHLRNFPIDLRGFLINHHSRLYPETPYLMDGVHLYAKLRVFSLDEPYKHTRIALFGEASRMLNAHDEAEPNLQGDNSGLGGGVIVTRLQQRFALSFTCAYTYPLPLHEQNERRKIDFYYPTSWAYNVSMGYRVYPKVYSSYKNVNINIYLEVLNKTYGDSKMYINDVQYDYNLFRIFEPRVYESLTANAYSEVRPSVQFVFNSTQRLDLGLALPVYSRSYLYYYPLYFLQFQKYFFRK